MKVHSILQLSTIDSVEQAQVLNSLGIYTVRDAAEYDGCRHAEYLMASFAQGTTEQAGLEHYVEADALTPPNIDALDELEVLYLLSVSETDAQTLGDVFGVTTLAQLAQFPPYEEARQLVRESVVGTFSEPPSAPEALVPELIGATYTRVRYSNYVREREYVLDDYSLLHFSDAEEPEPAAELIGIFYRSQFKFHLGYLASIHQRWISDGTHLGEILHSLALAPGESRNITVLDWYRRQLSAREEDTTVSEELLAEFTQNRALNEVVQSTAIEHLYGGTDIDATTRTTGAGLVGGYGTGSAQGSSVAAELMGLVGLPIGLVSGGAGGAASQTTSSAGSIGGSLVHSSSSVQGTLKSETTGERTIAGELVQNISDATVQNASNVRSVMSTVVVEDRQAGRQRAQTSNVTNYNHSHALTVQYYEVLHSYRVDTGVDSLSPMLFLPFGPISFNISVIQSYWYIFNKAIREVQPGKALEWNQVVKDFNPENTAFDASGDLRVERVKIIRSRAYSAPVRVEFREANPVVTLAISGFDMDRCLELKMTGNSDYVTYSVLDLEVFDVSSFFTVDAFELDEGIKATLRSEFMVELKRWLKIYLGDSNRIPFAPFTTTAENLRDNELANGLAGVSNRDNLKDDVDNDRFTILNTDATVDLTLNIDYTVADRNDQTQGVPQTIHKTYSYGVLKGEIDEEIADVTAHVNTQLATIADINPSDVIGEIERYFNFHKYGFTKYLLANLEKEQVKDVIEHLGCYGTTETLVLSALIDPNPLAMTENQLIFKLKEDSAGLRREIGQNFFASGTLDWDLDFPAPSGEDVAGIVLDYVGELDQYEKAIRQRRRRSRVDLPSSGVFAEAVIGRSNASEPLDVRRYINWQDMPIPNFAPEIVPVNVNQDYAQPVPSEIAPTVPVSVLNQIAPQQYPMPTSLTAALQAAGQPFTDMSKSAELTSILGTLAQVANNTAQLSGNLAGDAAANALNAAVALGQQVASMVGTAMSSNVADPPESLTEKGVALVELDDLAERYDGGPLPPVDQTKPNVVGVQVPEPEPEPTPEPMPEPEPVPPVHNTSDTVAGVLNVLVELPDPYDYATVNLLEIMDRLIPPGVDESLYHIYTTLKEFVLSLDKDDAEKGEDLQVLLQLVKGGLKSSPWSIVLGIIIDLLTNETVIETAEGLAVLLYDAIYYFSHPWLGYSGVHDELGVWLLADISYAKTRGQAAEIGEVRNPPFNNVEYLVGGAPINTAPNPPTWGAESLDGAILFDKVPTPATNLKVTTDDDAAGDTVTLDIEADLQMLVDTVSLVQKLRDDLSEQLRALYTSWDAATRTAIEQAVSDWLAANSASVEALLSSFGVPAAIITEVQDVLAAGGNLFVEVTGWVLDVTGFVTSLALGLLDNLTGIKDLVSGPTYIDYHLHLVATIAYKTTSPAGWTLSVSGETSSFPTLTVSSTSGANVVVVYTKNDIHPQGLLGLLADYDAIPPKTAYP